MKCGICGRRMIPNKIIRLFRHTPLYTRLDCGGDCLRCIYEAEGVGSWRGGESRRRA